MRKATFAAFSSALVDDVFQSPPSVRKATVYPPSLDLGLVISIPAFREEGDIFNERENLKC